MYVLLQSVCGTVYYGTSSTRKHDLRFILRRVDLFLRRVT